MCFISHSRASVPGWSSDTVLPRWSSAAAVMLGIMADFGGWAMMWFSTFGTDASTDTASSRRSDDGQRAIMQAHPNKMTEQKSDLVAVALA